MEDEKAETRVEWSAVCWAALWGFVTVARRAVCWVAEKAVLLVALWGIYLVVSTAGL